MSVCAWSSTACCAHAVEHPCSPSSSQRHVHTPSLFFFLTHALPPLAVPSALGSALSPFLIVSGTHVEEQASMASHTEVGWSCLASQDRTSGVQSRMRSLQMLFSAPILLQICNKRSQEKERNRQCVCVCEEAGREEEREREMVRRKRGKDTLESGKSKPSAKGETDTEKKKTQPHTHARTHTQTQTHTHTHTDVRLRQR